MSIADKIPNRAISIDAAVTSAQARIYAKVAEEERKAREQRERIVRELIQKFSIDFRNVFTEQVADLFVILGDPKTTEVAGYIRYNHQVISVYQGRSGAWYVKRVEPTESKAQEVSVITPNGLYSAAEAEKVRQDNSANLIVLAYQQVDAEPLPIEPEE